jgi:two-component system response regulator PilR (NtrC family)
MREGAYDYLIKPVKMEDARASIRRALEKHALLNENISLKEELKQQRSFGEMLGRSEAIQQVFDLIRRVAPSPTRVLITGESGTGKELVARSIHEHSQVASGPFLPINCGAIPAHLIESELFGYKRGAFTGANADKKGLFEAASGGTVFLDEIGEMPLETQVRFLRVLESMKVRPVGATAEIPLDCRILAATNKDLEDEVAAGAFREDLYYRLAAITIELPPLRRRDGDIEMLVRHFLSRYASEQNRTIEKIDTEALRALLSYDYPGNVRELQNVMQRAVTLCREGVITPDLLPPKVLRPAPELAAPEPGFPEEGVDLEALVERFERRLIGQALERTGGVKKDAARLLGISYRAMRHRLSKYGID